ncbi:MAG TPA: helix-turn-helix domain-containing protein [Stellaceae bacterium]
MAALDLLGRRWALRVIWELRSEAKRFRDLQQSSGASPSVLNQRLGELKQAGLLANTAEGYELTHAGRALIEAISPLHQWAEKWAKGLGS